VPTLCAVLLYGVGFVRFAGVVMLRHQLSLTLSIKSDIGAAWKKTSREGAEYLSVSIDDISFATKA
jgi:hypothetical protein